MGVIRKSFLQLEAGGQKTRNAREIRRGRISWPVITGTVVDASTDAHIEVEWDNLPADTQSIFHYKKFM